MKDCFVRFIVTTTCLLIGLHLPRRSNASKSSKTVLKLNYIPKHNGLLMWSVDLSMSNDWYKLFTCSWGESLISGKMEGSVKAPVWTPPRIFFVLFCKNVCANEVFSQDKCPRIQYSIQEPPFTRILWFWPMSWRIALSDSLSQPLVCRSVFIYQGPQMLQNPSFGGGFRSLMDVLTF